MTLTLLEQSTIAAVPRDRLIFCAGREERCVRRLFCDQRHPANRGCRSRVLRIVANRIGNTFHNRSDCLSHEVVIDLVDVNWSADGFQHCQR